mmetsp:Transcript_47075/g.111817  ORF Transcript_47075/g.111817 Transcript_47075/m.111817 type:complete len:268 (-) Transcript_47075:293-1096(-)
MQARCRYRLLHSCLLQSTEGSRTKLRHAAITTCKLLQQQNLRPLELNCTAVHGPEMWFSDLALHQEGVAPWELRMLENVGSMGLSARFRHRYLFHAWQMPHEEPQLLITLLDHLLFEDVVEVMPSDDEHLRVLQTLCRRQPRLIIHQREFAHDAAGPKLGDAVSQNCVIVVSAKPIHRLLARKKALHEVGLCRQSGRSLCRMRRHFFVGQRKNTHGSADDNIAAARWIALLEEHGPGLAKNGCHDLRNHLHDRRVQILEQLQRRKGF